MNLGVELQLSQQVSTYSEFGVYIPFSTTKHRTGQHGFMIKEEFKLYTGDDLFWSVEFCYSSSTYFRTDTIDLSIGSQINRYEKKYAVSRSFPGISVHVGERKLINKKIVIEYFTGAGIRFNTVSCDLDKSEALSRDLGDWTVPANYIERCGNNVIPKFYLGFNIGYVII